MIINVDTISSESVKLLKEWSRTQGVIFQELAECTLFFFPMAMHISTFIQLRLMAKPILLNLYRLILTWLCRFAILRFVLPVAPRWDSLNVFQGTTNNPKGVILKHKNLALATYSQLHGMSLSDTACLLSYLPLAHIYGVCIFFLKICWLRLTSSQSEFVNLPWLLLVVKLAILLETLCVCSKMPKFLSPQCSLPYLVSWIESIKLLWRVAMCLASKASFSKRLFQLSSRGIIKPER